MSAAWLTAAVALAAAVCGGGLYCARKVWVILSRARDFFDDWAGEPERPGVAARPGVMARLQAVDTELHPNGGGSLRDAVNAIRQELAEHRKTSQSDAAAAREAAVAAEAAAQKALTAARSLDGRMSGMEKSLAGSLATTCLNFKPVNPRGEGQD